MDIKSLPKILYIEDNAETRSLVGRLMAGRYVMLEAKDPIIGIELAEETRPDLVLLDLNLPNMNGVDVAIRLCSILKPGTPIVALTADFAPGMRERALAAGFTGFMNKPIDIDSFYEQIDEFLKGKHEDTTDTVSHLRAYQSELVERMEARVRELSDALYKNNYLHEVLLRRQKLLEAGARVSHEITSILDLDELLDHAVDIICTEFGFHYSGIFLVSEDGKRLDLHADHAAAGTKSPTRDLALPIDGKSMVGTAVIEKRAQIALDADGQENRARDLRPSATRSEMALPLIFKGNALGALTVQSAELNAFSEEDITSLQSLADQIANAIHNAQLVRQLDHANQELVRSKTYEAIATATGEAIHWVGNKAAPVPGSVRRLRDDLVNLLAAMRHIMTGSGGGEPDPLRGVAETLFEEAEAANLDLSGKAEVLLGMPEKRRNALISLESMLEDLQIIESSARTILDIKEDLIGPARQRKPVSFALQDEIVRIVGEMALPKGVVVTEWPESLPAVYGDPRQIDQVFNNLIKNAWEALDGRENPRIKVTLKPQAQNGYLLASVRDNGPGIPPEIQERIWVSFFTTKGGHGGTGLGLSACMEIIRQNSGKIWLESEAGKGAVFHVQLPVAK
jgi:signal transduction histidine kinase/DNA-binding response OmpR family regulator